MFPDDLRWPSIHVEILAEVLGQSEADQFDLLAHIAYGRPVRTRSQQARAFETCVRWAGRWGASAASGALDG